MVEVRGLWQYGPWKLVSLVISALVIVPPISTQLLAKSTLLWRRFSLYFKLTKPMAFNVGAGSQSVEFSMRLVQLVISTLSLDTINKDYPSELAMMVSFCRALSYSFRVKFVVLISSSVALYLFSVFTSVICEL